MEFAWLVMKLAYSESAPSAEKIGINFSAMHNVIWELLLVMLFIVVLIVMTRLLVWALKYRFGCMSSVSQIVHIRVLVKMMSCKYNKFI